MADNAKMMERVLKPGFIAALDQSGGSTPGALRLYGIDESAYSGEAEMFDLVHKMRVRIMTAPAFSGDKILGAILFERTMESEVNGTPTASYLWNERGVVPFLKVDSGLAAEADGVQVMKPMPKLDDLLKRAVNHGIFGTKMRSVINQASHSGIEAVVAQQFEVADQIGAHGLVPIIEPEVSIKSPAKGECETLLRDAILSHLDKVPDNRQVMLKLTIPNVPDLYLPLINHARVARVVALSGGYSRDEACKRLAQNHNMIASFSRALVENLRAQMSDAEFDTALAASIDQIYEASTVKT